MEVGHSYDGVANIMDNSEIWKAFMSSSPMYNVKKVKAPTLLLLGKKDLRVPSSPGLAYYQALKEANVPTKYVISFLVLTCPIDRIMCSFSKIFLFQALLLRRQPLIGFSSCRNGCDD